MSIKPICEVVDCRQELEDFGAIVLSPPDEAGSVRKVHLCQRCYGLLARLIDQEGLRRVQS